MMSLKVGIIGNGGIANSHMSGYLALGDRVEVVACCDINFEKAKEFAARYHISNCYPDCYAMLKDNQLDMVSVCTWNSAHAECTIAALNAGCNVLCEKPMAMNAIEAQAMQEAAEKNGKLLMLGFVRRHGNDAAAARDFVEKGFLGEIYYAKASYLRRCGFPGGWFGDKSRSGGGPLIDLGVHVIDLARYIMGNPKPVTVFGATFDKIGARDHIKTTGWVSQTVESKPIFTVEDLATAMIRFDNGAVLHVEASFNLNLKNPTGDINIFGNKAGLSLEPFELHTECNDRIADIVIHGDNGFDFSRDFNREVKNFADAVEGKAACLATAEDGVELMRILDAVYESAATGKSVDIVR
ncbi:MAG: Gfo/Idh/MocA family oxidoreductase [Clostridia bacterium]|nr:Gfo/Idh/MocA family oxidoreductase [Clostridia bacterium]